MQPDLTFPTRFGSNFLVLERLREVKPALERMVTSSNWSDWVKKRPPQQRDLAHSIKTHIMDNTPGGFWSKCDELLELMLPVIIFLKLVDSNTPQISKVYYRAGKVRH